MKECQNCPYKLGLISCVVSPCPQCPRNPITKNLLSEVVKAIVGNKKNKGGH